ncbi:MAG: ABC transporter substrate-binding protein [Trueperaceae bacterium]|nr:ABC transporter substrate-binding protein [Trueperaceae bacterium]
MITLLVTMLALGTFASAQQVVDFWHGMTGSRVAVLEQVVGGFNEIDPNMQINPVLMGTYEEGLARFLGAYPVGQEPPLIQIYEVGTQAMHDSGMIIPAYQIPERLGEEWDFGQYVGPIVRYYSRDGNLWSWPFASSTSMLYYNADHFRAAGLDPNKPPTTWDEVHEYGLALQAAGVVRDVIGFGWPDWQFEQQLALHDQPYVDNDNGRADHGTQVMWPTEFTDTLFAKWSAMAADGVWLYAGTEYSPNSGFTSGTLTMMLQSTSSLDGIMRTVGDDFEVRTAFIPRFNEYPRGNSIIGGNSLYVSDKASDAELRVIFEFFKYLARPEVDVFWHKNTGYFPATNAALKQLMDEGWFQESPNHLTAFLQILSGRTDNGNVVGSRIGPFVDARDHIRVAMEDASRGVAPRDALNRAAERINVLLQEWLEFAQ